MVQHPGPDREFAQWAKRKKIKWIGVDCGSADHPMNTIIRDWMPRQAAEADQVFQATYGQSLAERFTPDKYQLMHIEMFPHHIIHAECVGGEIDLLANRRTTIGFYPWRFVDGESCIGRCVAFLEDDEYEELAAVTVPSFLKTAGSLAMLSFFTMPRGCSSVSTDTLTARPLGDAGAGDWGKSTPAPRAAT